MSIFKKSAIALALTASLGLAGVASAATITGPGTNGAPISVAYFTVNSTGDVMTTGTYNLSIEAGDNLAGRTTGLGIRITLPAGVSLTSAGVAAGSGADAANGGTASVSSNNNNVVIISVTPGANGLNTNGPVVTLSDLVVTGATALANDGGSVAATVDFYDPNTAQTLTSTSGTLMVGANPVSFTTTASTSNPARIDVGAGGTNNSAMLPKVLFSASGSINGYDISNFDSGSVSSAVDSTVEDATTGAGYATGTNDSLTTTLTGNFAAFGKTGASVVLTTNCGSPSSSDIGGTVSADGKTVTFDSYTYTAGPLTACFYANGQDAIDASSVSAATSYNYGTVSTPASTGSMAALQYNGSSVEVPTFNPGGNTTQQSFLRVINNGQLSGKVTIYGYDQNGTKHGPVTFTLASGTSMQLNSDDMSAGNAAKFSGSLGTGVGKWRLDVTGEFDGLEVQSLMRNNNSGTVSNLSGSIKPAQPYPYPY